MEARHGVGDAKKRRAARHKPTEVCEGSTSMKTQQPRRADAPPLALISDVDGTLLGDDAALEELAAWLAERRDRLRIVYNSGRFADSIRESVETTALPVPDAVIGGVGTQIRDYETDQPIDGWPPAGENWDARRIASLLKTYNELEPQPAEFQSEYKLSYYARDVNSAFLDRIQTTLRDAGIAAELIYSSKRDLDLLPAGVNKGTASAFLARYWDMAPDRVIVSGDSGNDLTLFQHGFKGIVVGNGHPELKALVDPEMYQSSNNYAAGVREGLEFWINVDEAFA